MTKIKNCPCMPFMAEGWAALCGRDARAPRALGAYLVRIRIYGIIGFSGFPWSSRRFLSAIAHISNPVIPAKAGIQRGADAIGTSASAICWSAPVLAGFTVMAKGARRAERNPENPANPVNPDSDKRGAIVRPQSRACARRHPHPSLLPSREKGFVARYLCMISDGGLGFNHLDSRFRGNDENQDLPL